MFLIFCFIFKQGQLAAVLEDDTVQHTSTNRAKMNFVFSRVIKKFRIVGRETNNNKGRTHWLAESGRTVR
jgi:hypothetical protein